MVAIHEGFHHDASMFARRGLHRIDFIHIQRQWLLAQHMFAGFDSFDRPFGMKMIGNGL